MTKVEELTRELEVFTGDQLDGLIAYARYLRSEPYYASAPAEALVSIDRGLADANAGRVTAADDVFARLDKKIASRQT
jgi:hypothetical protein